MKYAGGLLAAAVLLMTAALIFAQQPAELAMVGVGGPGTAALGPYRHDVLRGNFNGGPAPVTRVQRALQLSSMYRLPPTRSY